VVRGTGLQLQRQRPPTFDVGLVPHQLLHAVLGAHPGAAGFAPAGRGGDPEFELLFLRQHGGEAEGLGPLGAHVGQALRHQLRRHHLGVEVLQAAQARARHPVEILPDALFGDVPVQPVPPHARTGALGRVGEAGGERIVRGGRGRREQAGDGGRQRGAA
jgi:hypothetical protein